MNQTENNDYMAHTHDKFFRTVMSDSRIAREFLGVHLPKEILEVTDLGNLILQPRSYIDEVRKESIVDILYKTTMKEQESYIYLLLEHQSTADELMPFRMLKYTCNVMDQHLKDTKKKLLPFIYPMVIYHAERPYPYSTNIHDIVEAPKEFVERYFLKSFQLIDLGRIEDEELKKHAWVGVTEFALKHIFARDILPYLKDISEILRRIDQAGGRDYISIVLQYLVQRGELRDREAFFELINREISSEVGDKVMSLAEQLMAEGKKEGIAEGREQGKLEIAERLLSEGVEFSFISKITGLSMYKIKSLVDNGCC